MSDFPTSDEPSLPVELKRQVDAVCNRFEEACKQRRSPQAADYLAGVPKPARAVLRRELEFIEAHYRHQPDPANTPAGEPTGPELPSTDPQPPLTESLGTLIAGRYKLLQHLGEGGMGTVFMAEQEQPVKRRVALKIIKAGMDSAQVIARFEQERQALAMMDHPNIAKVLDAGTTGSERHKPEAQARESAEGNPSLARRACMLAGPSSSWNWSKAFRSPSSATRNT